MSYCESATKAACSVPVNSENKNFGILHRLNTKEEKSLTTSRTNEMRDTNYNTRHVEQRNLSGHKNSIEKYQTVGGKSA